MTIEVSFEGKIRLSDETAHLVALHDSLIGAAKTSLGKVRALGEYQQAEALLIGQAVASAEAVHVLCLAGRANHARPIARSMVENLVNAYYIARDPETRAKRFWIYRPIPLAKVAEARSREFGITEGLEELRLQAAEASRLLAPHRGWAAADLRSRAVECDLFALYDLFYPEASAFSHGDASTWDTLRSEEGVLELGPSPNGIDAVVAPAISALVGGLFLFGDVFHDVGLQTALELIGRKLPERTKRIDLRAQFEVHRTKRCRSLD